jgi:hypothetical protein
MSLDFISELSIRCAACGKTNRVIAARLPLGLKLNCSDCGTSLSAAPTSGSLRAVAGSATPDNAR